MLWSTAIGTVQCSRTGISCSPVSSRDQSRNRAYARSDHSSTRAPANTLFHQRHLHFVPEALDRWCFCDPSIGLCSILPISQSGSASVLKYELAANPHEGSALYGVSSSARGAPQGGGRIGGEVPSRIRTRRGRGSLKTVPEQVRARCMHSQGSLSARIPRRILPIQTPGLLRTSSLQNVT